jgi:3-isopropylmalate/(R)-2-methylmalate dehydratase small subunit
MEPFKVLTAPAVPLDVANVDTDQIIPARFLTLPRDQIGRHMFHDLRYDEADRPRAGVALNDPAYRGARILVARENFGCGSSRESAVWSLMADSEPDATNAFLCVIAPSYGDIFFSNASKNGLLTVRLPQELVSRLIDQLREEPGAGITVDLPRQLVIGPDGSEHRFEIDPFRKECLLRGVDDIELTLDHAGAIEQYERRRREVLPWVLGASS